MIELDGTFYDGVDSVGRPAILRAASPQDVYIQAGSERIESSTSALAIDSRLGSTPRRISWGERASFVTLDNDGADQLARMLPGKPAYGWVVWLEDRLSAVLLALFVTIGAVGSFAVWGVPLIADIVARSIPVELSGRLGQSTLSGIDQVLSPSDLPHPRQTALLDYFRDYGSVDTIEFRRAGRLGANALTLSATTIVLTDELVALADNDEELLAVYLHELGHARLHHVERSVLQNSAWLVLLTVITGDFSGAGELLLTVPLMVGQMAYSRDFERQADAFAIDTLLMAGISPDRLASILEKLEGSSEVSDGQPRRNREDGRWAVDLFEYFSTHPATRERVAAIRNRANETP